MADIDVMKWPHGWGQVAFWTAPDPPFVPYDEPKLYLHWAGPQGATYTLEYYTPQTGIVNVPAAGQPPLSNQGQYPARTRPTARRRTST